jgi:hypothetical protein
MEIGYITVELSLVFYHCGCTARKSAAQPNDACILRQSGT